MPMRIGTVSQRIGALHTHWNGQTEYGEGNRTNSTRQNQGYSCHGQELEEWGYSSCALKDENTKLRRKRKRI
jgi:hypothetical protein